MTERSSRTAWPIYCKACGQEIELPGTYWIILGGGNYHAGCDMPPGPAIHCDNVRVDTRDGERMDATK